MSEPDERDIEGIAAHARSVGVDLPVVNRVGLDTRAGGLSALRWGAESPRIVLLHGAGLNARTWNGVLLRLGMPALAIDLPGHGESDRLPVEGYAISAMGDMVAEALDDAGWAVTCFVGHSIGSFVAARAAAALGGVQTLVAVDATPHKVGTTDPTRIHGGTLGELVAAMRERMPDRDPKSLERAIIRSTRERENGLREWLWDENFFSAVPLRARERDAIWASFDAAAYDTVLLRAERGGVLDVEAEEFLRRVPGASAVGVESAGHNLQTDRPEWLADWLRAMLAD